LRLQPLLAALADHGAPGGEIWGIQAFRAKERAELSRLRPPHAKCAACTPP
jgi:hypothetical protein